jgi:hypothetical protein
LGLAALPAVSYSAGARLHQGQHAGRSSKAKPKKPKCKKGQGKRNGRCVKKKTAPTSTMPTTTPTTEASIPTQIRTELLQAASDYALDHGFENPREIEAVATTIAKAGHAADHPTLGGETAVYVVAMRISTTCTAPPGGTCGQRPVLELEYLAGGVDGLRAETQASYPNLASLGVPIVLSSVGGA